MAKDVSNEEDDDKFEKMDDESLGFLEQVKKGKARNFVLSMKGNKVKSLLVKKKPIKDKDRKEARGGGFQPIFGVATGTGLNITFTVARSDGFDDKTAGTKTEKLKKFLKEQTGTAYKPEFALVDTPPAIPFDEEDLNDPLIAKFMKMEPVIGKACDTHPDAVPQIEASVKMIRGLLGDDETRADAGPKIDEFVQYLKDLLAGGTAVPPAPPLPGGDKPAPAPDAPPPPPPIDQAALATKLAEALKKLKPLMDKVINADPNRQGELHATMAQIVGEIKAKQFDQAKQNVTDFATLLKSLAAQQTAAPTTETGDRMSEFTERRNALEPRLLEAQKADREKATKLGAVWNYADEQAQVDNFANAFKALDRLATAIDDVLGTKTSSAPPSGTDLEAACRELKNSIYPRVKDAVANNPDQKDEVIRLLGLASKHEKAGQFSEAIELYQQLGDLISTDSSESPVSSPTTAGRGEPSSTEESDSDESKEPVDVLAVWRDAKDSADEQFNKLTSILRKSSHPYLQKVAELGLHGLAEDTGGVYVSMQASLFDFNRSSGDAKLKAMEKVLTAIGKYRAFINKSKALQVLESYHPVTISKTMLDALSTLETEMKKLAA